MKLKLIIFYKNQNIEINKIIKKYNNMKRRNIQRIRELEEEIIKGDKKCYH